VPYDPKRHAGRLRRLAPDAYRGFAFVHWTMTLEYRATSWLDAAHHLKVRELLCHALARYHLACLAYCLMHDHGHFLWAGLAAESDQRLAAAAFRKAWNAELQGTAHALQLQPYDHVLRERDRGRNALATVAGYIWDNPVRKGLVADRWDWPYSGALVPGYPELTPRRPTYWESYWRIYAAHVDVVRP
jgi:putative transposase